jgi:hypothetical protein
LKERISASPAKANPYTSETRAGASSKTTILWATGKKILTGKQNRFTLSLMPNQQRIYNIGGEYLTAEEARCYLLGKMVRHYVRHQPDSDFGKECRQLLDPYITDPQDRAAFNLEPWSPDIIPLPGADPLRVLAPDLFAAEPVAVNDT